MFAVPALREDEAREALVMVMRRMHETGLNRGTAGNASIRLAEGMLITPSGVAPAELTPGAMVLVGWNGLPLRAGLRPSTEGAMHRAILQARGDAGAVVHCHSRHATILACRGLPIEPIHYMILTTGAARVPLAPYATFGTPELAEAAVAAMGQGRACLLAHHGQIAIGATWQQALATAEEVEEQAAVTFGALLLGGAPILSEQQLASARTRFLDYGQAPATARGADS